MVRIQRDPRAMERRLRQPALAQPEIASLVSNPSPKSIYGMPK